MGKRKTTTVVGPPHYRMTVEARTSNPYECGFLELEIYESRLLIRYEGAGDWTEIPWHEVALCSGTQSKRLREDLQILREKAQSEGYEDGFTHGSKERMREVQESRIGPKIVSAIDGK